MAEDNVRKGNECEYEIVVIVSLWLQLMVPYLLDVVPAPHRGHDGPALLVNDKVGPNARKGRQDVAE